jgi:hypothetical protein
LVRPCVEAGIPKEEARIGVEDNDMGVVKVSENEAEGR